MNVRNSPRQRSAASAMSGYFNDAGADPWVEARRLML